MLIFATRVSIAYLVFCPGSVDLLRKRDCAQCQDTVAAKKTISNRESRPTPLVTRALNVVPFRGFSKAREWVTPAGITNVLLVSVWG
jgi:hypothetical protein